MSQLGIYNFEFQPTALYVHTKRSRTSPDTSGESFAPSNPDTNTNKNRVENLTEKHQREIGLPTILQHYLKAKERLIPLLKHLKFARLCDN